jgi:hypothetical protein
VPSAVEFSHEDFLKYRETWLLWRSLGRYDGNGSWVAPLSFPEAIDLPKAMLDVFQELDHFFEQMKKHQAKKQPKPAGVN